ncbi:MAG: putative F0F1-ATPase subunit Ca2+/Mg2+ transporter [Chloroflexi bacterium]|nr:putative F0F1-ATPase subunit Ca2+/Mg2+ transporter [Chloroflexota bacterium]
MRNLTIWQAVAYASELGFALAATVLVGTGLGYLTDQWLRNEAPVFIVVGSLLGLAAGTYSIARLAKAVTRPEKE